MIVVVRMKKNNEDDDDAKKKKRKKVMRIRKEKKKRKRRLEKRKEKRPMGRRNIVIYTTINNYNEHTHTHILTFRTCPSRLECVVCGRTKGQVQQNSRSRRFYPRLLG